MAIVLNGKKLAEARLNGKKLKEAWINGHRVFPDPMLNVQPARLDFPADGGSMDFIIESNEAWTITCNTNPTPFIISKYTGSGNDTITIKVGKNTASPNQRTLTIRTTSGLEKTVTLFQNAATGGSTSWIFNVEWTVSNINIREGLVYMGKRLPVVQVITSDGHQVISIPKEIADNDYLIFSFRALYTPAIDSTLNIIIHKLSGSPSMYSAKGSSGSYSMSPINTGILINNITKIELVIT